MTLSRKEFLMSLGGAAVGVPLGVVGQRWRYREPPPPEPVPPPPEHGVRSYSQGGEDVIVNCCFDLLGIKDITYLDIGAYDPIVINNTYFFYLKGARGVLVEPNVAMCEKLRAVRPEDKTLTAGIGVTAVREADYYIMSEPSWNTFSREEAEHMEKSTNGKITIQKVIKMPLLNINDVMAEHFQKAPTFVSIDAEGLHFDILKAIDYQRFRPKVICIETMVSGTNKTIPEIPKFMAEKDYVARGGSLVNTIFVDSKLL